MTLELDTPTHLAISRPLLADAVYDRVLADIVRGRYAPYQRLNVDQLAAEFGVSRTPVREGLTRLQWDRFVDIAPNARTSVSAWGLTDMRNRLEVVTRLVTFMARDPRMSLDALIDEWRDILDGHSSEEAGDAQAFLAISELLVSLTCNNVSAHIVRCLLRPLRLFLDNDIAQAHGVDLALGSGSRFELLRCGLHAAREQDHSAIAAAIDRYADSLLIALLR